MIGILLGLVVLAAAACVGVKYHAQIVAALGKSVLTRWLVGLLSMLVATSLHGQATRDSVVCHQCVDSLYIPRADSVPFDTTITIWHHVTVTDTVRRDSIQKVPIVVPPDTTKPPVSSSGHPNEPKGYGFSRAIPGTAIPNSAGANGRCYASSVGAVSVQGNALQTRFRAGLASGGAPANYGCYDYAGRSLSALYFSAWVLIVGPNYENQATGTKMGFLAAGRQNGGENEVWFMLVNPAGKQAIQSAWPMQVRQQGVPQANGTVNRNLTQNVDGRQLMTAGTWHHWELAATINTMGQADGTLRLWIDGVLVSNYRDVIYRAPGYPNLFGLYKWNPTWGGSTGYTKTRDDFMQIRDVYVSGLP